MNLALLSAGDLRVGFHPSTAQPASLYSLATGIEYLRNGPQPFFRLCLKKNGETFEYTALHAVATTVAPHSGGVSLYYNFLDRQNICVLCTVESVDGELKFGIDVRQTGFEVMRVDYPVFGLPKALVPGEDWAVYEHGFRNGILVHGFENAPKEPDLAFSDGYTNPVQMIACGTANETLYVASNDRDHHARYLLPQGVEAGLDLTSAFFPEDRKATRIVLPYDVLISCLPEGEWYAAAEKFRGWLYRQPYMAKKLTEREDVPAWWLNSPVVVAIKERGKRNSELAQKTSPWCHPLEKGVPRLVEIADRMGSPINVQIFHWEKDGAFVNGDHFPPLSGFEGTAKFFDMLHEHGHTGGAYIIPHKWTFKAIAAGTEMNPFLFDHDITDIAVLDESGMPRFSKWDWPWRKRVCVCMGEQRVRDSIVNDFLQFSKMGADYIQFDTFAGVTPTCWSEHHGHPSGMGKWQIDNTLEVIKAIRGFEKNYVLTYEAEPIPEVIPLSHGFVERGLHPVDEAGIEMIPLYQFMYHPYTQGFSGENCGDFNTPDNFFYHNAISFISGDLTMISLDMQGHVCMQTHEIDDFNMTVDDFCPEEDIYAFLKRINGLRREAARAYISEGEMIRGPKIACACGGILEGKNQRLEIPAVLGSTWRAADGTIGTVLVNHTQAEQAAEADLRTDACKGVVISEDGSSKQCVLSSGVLKLAVPARSAILIVHQ